MLTLAVLRDSHASTSCDIPVTSYKSNTVPNSGPEDFPFGCILVAGPRRTAIRSASASGVRPKGQGTKSRLMAGQALSWKMKEKRILSDPQFTCLWEELRKGNEEKEDAMKGEKTF